jgi:RNase H-like domain found in reverse transcriptase
VRAGQRSFNFLGHVVSAACVAPLPDRVAAICAFPRPQTVEQLQAFLGFLNFYPRFVPAAAQILRPLMDTLGGGPRGKAVVTWNEERTAAFQAARESLADTALLDHPAAAAELVLVTDASASHVGAVLQQRQRGQSWRPIGFYSKKLSQAEAKYSAFDRELLAVYSAIIHFQHLVEGQNFAVLTDHKPLIGVVARQSHPKSDRQRRHLSFVAEFTADIRHISGKDNVVADTLSRPPPPAHAPGDQSGPSA